MDAIDIAITAEKMSTPSGSRRVRPTGNFKTSRRFAKQLVAKMIEPEKRSRKESMVEAMTERDPDHTAATTLITRRRTFAAKEILTMRSTGEDQHAHARAQQLFEASSCETATAAAEVVDGGTTLPLGQSSSSFAASLVDFSAAAAPPSSPPSTRASGSSANVATSSSVGGGCGGVVAAAAAAAAAVLLWFTRVSSVVSSSASSSGPPVYASARASIRSF
jgi:hypothetical protein